MNRLYQNVLELVGQTPILPLNRLVSASSATVLVKLENHNPSGSVKDRVALALVEDAASQGQITSGGHLVYATGATGLDLWIRSQGQTPVSLLDLPGNQSRPVFSPNGRFLAYQSDESDQDEVYVRPFPDVQSQRILIAQGRRPRWSLDGREILYLTDEGVMRVPLSYPPDEPDSLLPGRSAMLFPLPGIVNFDVTSDGERLAIERFPLETAAREIHVVLNWTQELLERVPIP